MLEGRLSCTPGSLVMAMVPRLTLSLSLRGWVRSRRLRQEGSLEFLGREGGDDVLLDFHSH